EILLSMNQLVRQEMKAELVIVLHPYNYFPDQRNPLKLAKNFQDFFSSLPMPVFDMGCFYNKKGMAFTDMAYDRVGHLTLLGHQKVTDALTEIIVGKSSAKECFLNLPKQ